MCMNRFGSFLCCLSSPHPPCLGVEQQGALTVDHTIRQMFNFPKGLIQRRKGNLSIGKYLWIRGG